MSQKTLGEGEAYVKRFNVLRQKCKQNFYDIVLIKHHLQASVQNISLLEHDELCRDINVLGVGSGDGKPDIEIARIIKEELLRSEKHRQVKISSVSLEPNECFFHLFEVLLRSLPSSLLDGGSSFKFLAQSFEDFIAENKPSSKFHIIHFIHSIYHFDIENILTKCFDDLLFKDGKIFCIASDKNDISYKLCKKQGHLTSTGDPTSTDQVLEVVKKNGWKYKESTIEFALDASEVFDEDSIEGNYQLDFMTQTVNFRATADPKLFQETMKMLKEFTTAENGRRVGKRVDKLLMIEK